jgi:hypothetical protein
VHLPYLSPPSQVQEHKKKALDRTPSVESRSRLVERLQLEKADLQRHLEMLEKERDGLKKEKEGLQKTGIP